MNFDFSDDMKTLRGEARRFLAERSAPKDVRRVLNGDFAMDHDLWREMAKLGWLGIAIPEAYGGSGLGYDALCILAEEVGRACATVPFSSSVYLATEALLRLGTNEQKRTWLPKLASGDIIATLALPEGSGAPDLLKLKTSERDGKLTGDKWPIPDAAHAGIAITAAIDAHGVPSLYIVDLGQPGVTREPIRTLDPTRAHARVQFTQANVERLGDKSCGAAAIQRLVERAAILMAFEQLGGAETSLAMAVAYAKDRYAFGRPIGSFQAIKHKLADMYVANELARSNAYWGTWALTTDAAELPLVAASARVAATRAYDVAAKENIQTHGGMGMTWETDAHLYLRRAYVLSAALGSSTYWKDRLVAALETRNAS